MRFSTLPLLVGAALANPVAELQARQLNPSQSSSCSVSHTGLCRNAAATSARNFCSSLGFGTTVSTIQTSSVINRTLVRTFSATVATRTITAPAVTSTSTSVRTIVTTQTQTARSTTIITEVSVESITGTIESCSGYTPQQTARSDVDVPLESSSPAYLTTSSDSAPATESATSTTSSSTTSSSTTTSSEVPAPVVTNGFYGSCPGSNLTVLEFSGGARMQVLCGDLEDSSPVVRSVRRDLADCASACLAANAAAPQVDEGDMEQGLHDVCKGVTFVESGMDAKWCYFKQWTTNRRGFLLWPYGRTTPGIPESASIVSMQRIRYYGNEAYPDGYGNDVAWAAKRAESPVEPRQAAPIKPACLRATNAAQTTSACNCVIPSSTVTVRSTSTSLSTSWRVVSTTVRITATTTATPTVRTSTTRTTTMTRVRTITSWSRTTTTERTTSTVAYSLAATPTAFYIVDANMAFAEWPADADEIFYHVQYDWDQSDDEYAPTVFTMTGSNNDELRVANLEDDNGPAEGYLVAGQAYDGPGFQLVAQLDTSNMPVPGCQIQVNAEGQCPLVCNVGTNTVNHRNSDGLWTLMPEGTDDGFQNFVMAAEVDLESVGVVDMRM